jgi:ABC-type transporter Mla MlaB component
VLERLADDRVPVLEHMRTGQLTIIGADDTRTALRSPAEAVRDILTEQIGKAVAEGWSGFRMTGQMSYGLLGAGGVSLAEYDATMSAALAGKPASALCLYDRRHYPDEAIEVLRAVHDVEVDAPAIYDDNLLRITSAHHGEARLAGEIDHSNRPQIRRLLLAALDQSLRSHSDSGDITLDLSSLRFIDVAGAVSLVHAAEEFPSSHRCGAPFAAQLVLELRSDAPGGGSPAGPDPL